MNTRLTLADAHRIKRTLPLPVQCAIEWLGNGDAKTSERLSGLLDHFLGTYGLQAAPECEQWRAQAWLVAQTLFDLA